MGPRNERPSAAEFGKIRAALARQGYTPEQVNAAVGQGVGGRTREQISARLRAWLSARPRALR